MYAHYIKYELKTARGKLYGENCMGKTAWGKLPWG